MKRWFANGPTAWVTNHSCSTPPRAMARPCITPMWCCGSAPSIAGVGRRMGAGVAARRDWSTDCAHPGKTVLPLDDAQLHAFAGNMLEVQSAAGARHLVMSAERGSKPARASSRPRSAMQAACRWSAPCPPSSALAAAACAACWPKFLSRPGCTPADAFCHVAAAGTGRRTGRRGARASFRFRRTAGDAVRRHPQRHLESRGGAARTGHGGGSRHPRRLSTRSSGQSAGCRWSQRIAATRHACTAAAGRVPWRCQLHQFAAARARRATAWPIRFPHCGAPECRTWPSRPQLAGAARWRHLPVMVLVLRGHGCTAGRTEPGHWRGLPARAAIAGSARRAAQVAQ